MSHVLYEPKDFTREEAERRNALYIVVVEQGLGVCKQCGAGESELDDYPTCAEYRDFQRKKR